MRQSGGIVIGPVVSPGKAADALTSSAMDATPASKVWNWKEGVPKRSRSGLSRRHMMPPCHLSVLEDDSRVLGLVLGRWLRQAIARQIEPVVLGIVREVLLRWHIHTLSVVEKSSLTFQHALRPIIRITFD